MKRLIVVALLAMMTCLGGCGFEIVDTGHRGVKVTFGEVEQKSLPEGLHWYNPINSNIIEMDVRTVKKEAVTETYTRDVQQATIKYTINYNLDPSTVHTIYQTVGGDWANVLIPQVVLDSIKEVVGKWDAVDLIANRDKGVSEIGALITTRLGVKHVIVTGFAVNDLAYTKEFEKAVEAKVVAIQSAIEEKNRTQQINELATQKVATATAEAKSMQIRANALAQNPKLTEWEAVQKWDGKLPQYMLGGTTPFINLK